MRSRIKICGIRDTHSAQFAESLGVHALGMVFVPDTPRVVDIATAREIATSVGPFIQRVGLFVNPSADEVIDVLAEVELDILQFHGEESVEFCQSFGLPYLKAVRVQNQQQIEQADRIYTSAAALLVDSFSDKARGGTGETFDWQLIPRTTRPLILAGGLNAENVAEAITLVAPYAVDVSSGVESAPGVKDTAKMRDFVEAVGKG